MATPQVVTVADACTTLQVTVSTIYRMFDRGELTRLKVGGATRIPIAEVEALAGSRVAA